MISATSPNQEGVAGTDSEEVWMITEESAILVISTSLLGTLLFFLIKEAYFYAGSLLLTSRCAIRGISGRSSAAPGARSAPSARCGPGASTPGRLSSNLLPAQVFFEADEALVADDDVVDQLDVQHAARRHELPGRLDILRRGRGVAAGVVVTEDQARTVADDGRAEDLCCAQHRAVGG